MPAHDFVDTNVLVYAYDAGAPRKRDIAQQLLLQAFGAHSFGNPLVVSTQVLAEFATTLLHKLSPGVSPNELLAILDALAPFRVVSPDASTVRRAIEARETYGIHFYDGMIVAAAEQAGCKRIWSEDLTAGQEYFGVVVQNPFHPR